MAAVWLNIDYHSNPLGKMHISNIHLFIYISVTVKKGVRGEEWVVWTSHISIIHQSEVIFLPNEMRDDREEMKKWERNSDGLSKGDEVDGL